MPPPQSSLAVLGRDYVRYVAHAAVGGEDPDEHAPDAHASLIGTTSSHSFSSTAIIRRRA